MSHSPLRTKLLCHDIKRRACVTQWALTACPQRTHYPPSTQTYLHKTPTGQRSSPIAYHSQSEPFSYTSAPVTASRSPISLPETISQSAPSSPLKPAQIPHTSIRHQITQLPHSTRTQPASACYPINKVPPSNQSLSTSIICSRQSLTHHSISVCSYSIHLVINCMHTGLDSS